MYIVLACPLLDPIDTAAQAARLYAVSSVTINSLFWSDNRDLFIFETQHSAAEVKEFLTADPDLSRLFGPVTILQCRAIHDVAVLGSSEMQLRRACDL